MSMADAVMYADTDGIVRFCNPAQSGKCGFSNTQVQRELSQVLRCTPRNFTNLVDTLEARGFALREPHPTDWRVTLVSLTRRGKSEPARMQAAPAALAGALFAGLSSSDLSAFAAVLDLVLTRSWCSGAIC
jgi:DNA-binding MarR family transcriptional regulator